MSAYTGTDEITNTDDYINVSEIGPRIAVLNTRAADTGLEEWEREQAAEEAAGLVALLDEIRGMFRSGHEPALIRASHFGEYAREYAADIIGDELGILDGFIDWDGFADSLKMDYAELDFGGVTYWAR